MKQTKSYKGIISDGYIVVPCGKCPACKDRRANDWIMRIQKEERSHHNGAVFATLTYRNEACCNEPAIYKTVWDDEEQEFVEKLVCKEKIRITPHGFLTLCKIDLQNFFKKLRFQTNLKTIKYYAVGEYGSQFNRPHYHAIIFDVTAEAVAKAWAYGDTHCGQVTGESIAYTCKYICKESQIPLHKNDDRLKEFSLMSKGLGIGYLTPEMKKWHIDNMASHVVKEGGYFAALPRYYKNKIFNDVQKEQIRLDCAEKYAEQFNRDVRDAGSQKAFYRERFERVRLIKLLNKQKQSQKRNKI